MREQSAIMFIGYTVIILCALVQIGTVGGLYITYEDAGIVSIDQTYFDPENSAFFINGDNQVAVNLSIVKKFPPETVCHFEILEYSMGEYVLPIGINIWRKFCEIIQKPIVHEQLYTHMGISSDSCPPEPGNYSHEGYAVPLANLPKTVREDKYMVVYEFVYEKKVLLAAKIYLDVQN